MEWSTQHKMGVSGSENAVSLITMMERQVLRGCLPEEELAFEISKPLCIPGKPGTLSTLYSVKCVFPKHQILRKF